MKAKVSKTKNQSDAKVVSIRVRETTKERASSALKQINQKELGRNLKLDDLFNFAITRLTEEDIRTLREMSLSNEDRKEMLRQKYVATRGPISKDDFTGFMLTHDFGAFLSEQNSIEVRTN